MARTDRYGGSERCQGTVIIENGDQYGKCRLPVVRFFLGTNWGPAANNEQQGPWS